MFEGKVAIVTGSARGIGFAIGQELAKAGARVALVDLKADLAEQAATQLRSAGYDAIAVAYCLSDNRLLHALRCSVKLF